MSINVKELSDLFVVSKKKQVVNGSVSAAENPATADYLIAFDEGSKIDISETRENNQAEKTGYWEPTRIETGEKEAAGTLTQNKSQPATLAWAFAMMCNDHADATAGTTGHVHTSQMTYGIEPAYFTAVHQKGDIADMRRHVGVMIDTLGLTMTKGANLAATVGVKGLGKTDNRRITEVVSALDNVTTISYTNDIHDESVDNVTVWADTTGDGTPDKKVTVTVVDNTNNDLTITSLGGAGSSVDYHLVYTADKLVTGYTWSDLSSISKIDEFRPRTRDIQLILGGSYDGTDIVGGEIAKCEISSVNYNYAANSVSQKCFRGSSTAIDHSSHVDVGLINQTLTVDREIKDFIMDYWHESNMYPAFKIHAVSPVEFESGHNYEIEIIIPKVGFTDNQQNVVEGKWSTQSSLTILKDDSVNDYPSIIFKVKNQETGLFV